LAQSYPFFLSSGDISRGSGVRQVAIVGLVFFDRLYRLFDARKTRSLTIDALSLF